MMLNRKYVKLLVKYGHQIQNGATPKQIEALINRSLLEKSPKVQESGSGSNSIKGGCDNSWEFVI